jgi:hypothetical protein
MSTKDPQIHWIRVASSVVANTATVAGSVFNINATGSSTVNLYTGDPSAGGGNGDKPAAPPMRPVDLALFNFLTRGIFLVAILCLLLQVALGFAWPEPTAAQAITMSAVDWGFKVGLGLVVGLIGGKSFVP